MTAEYPTEIFDPRVLENVSDVEFDATKVTRIYAEDINSLAEEIIALEETLGLSPEGSAMTVAARLDAIEAAVASATVTVLAAEETPDDSALLYTFDVKPKIVFAGNIPMPEGDGWSWTGTQVLLVIPVGSGNRIFAI